MSTTALSGSRMGRGVRHTVLGSAAALLLLAGLAGPADALNSRDDDDENSLSVGETTTPNANEGAGALNFTMDASPEPDSPEAHATDFLRDLLARVSEIRNDSSLTEDQRYASFQDVLSQGLAIDVIGQQMLGSHRDAATEQQLQSYNAVFPDYITTLYAAQLSRLSSVNMLVTDIRTGRRGDVLVRTSLLRSSGAPISVDWRIHNDEAADERKIVDIFVEGASIMLTKREEFGALVNAQGIEALLTELQDRARDRDLQLL